MQHRVTNIGQYPTVVLSEGIGRPYTLLNNPYGFKNPTAWNAGAPNSEESNFLESPVPTEFGRALPAEMLIYDHNFDDMNNTEKAETILMLLDTLPSVKEMREYILRHRRSSEASLSAWVDRISPAAFGILRWIVASNRSCIVQVDKFPGEKDCNGMNNNIQPDQRVKGMDLYIQFRFAQGAPDKERRFMKCLQDTQQRLGLEFSSLFAWHGSPLHNWHSIIRTGLDFAEIAHGRAFGHGVYHSQSLETSLAYAPISVVSLFEARFK
jgi:ubiquitin-conjugating enzyme E2 Q